MAISDRTTHVIRDGIADKAASDELIQAVDNAATGVVPAGSISTLELADLAVTTAKLGPDAVDQDKIAADVAGDGLSQAADGSLEPTIGAQSSYLASAVMMANVLKYTINGHAADGTLHTTAIDNVNYPIIAADASDFASLRTLGDAMLTAYAAHEVDAALAMGWVFHAAQETAASTLTDATAIISLDDAVAKLNDLYLMFIQHDGDATSHGVVGQYYFVIPAVENAIGIPASGVYAYSMGVPASDILYVDIERPDFATFLGDGSPSKPFHEIQDALDQIISNADNATDKPYTIMVAPGTYNDGLEMNDALLVNVTIIGSGPSSTVLDNAVGVVCTGNNDLFATLHFQNMGFATGDIVFTGDTDGAGNHFLSDCIFTNCIFENGADIAVTNANIIKFDNCTIDTNVEFNEVFAVLFVGPSFTYPYAGTVTVTHDSANPISADALAAGDNATNMYAFNARCAVTAASLTLTPATAGVVNVGCHAGSEFGVVGQEYTIPASVNVSGYAGSLFVGDWVGVIALIGGSIQDGPMNGIQRKFVARATFNWDDLAGPGTPAVFACPVHIPDNAIITRMWVDVVTGFAGDAGGGVTDAQTIAIHVEGADDMIAAVAINAATDWDAGLRPGIPVDTVASMVKLTDDRAITVTVAAAGAGDLTAGAMVMFFEYVVSD